MTEDWINERAAKLKHLLIECTKVETKIPFKDSRGCPRCWEDHLIFELQVAYREGLKAGREQMVEECAKIADEHMEICDGNGCPVISEKIRQIAQRDGGIEK